MGEKCMLESGQKIVFLGDSITEAPNGYVKVVQDMLGASVPGMDMEFVNAGIGGNKVTDMLERIGEDVIAHDPDWITVSVGINDVWHGFNGTPFDRFAELYDELVRRLKNQTVARIALFTTTVIGEDLDNQMNTKLLDYNDYIRATARKYDTLLVPMQEEFFKAISAWHRIGDELRFTTDGVHMTPVGDCLMAFTLLRAWGVI